MRLADRVRERSKTLDALLARDARQLPRVRRFRFRVLGGRPLSRSEARGLMVSPLARFQPLSFFQARSIPLVRHTVIVRTRRVLVPEYNTAPRNGKEVESSLGVRGAPVEVVYVRFGHQQIRLGSRADLEGRPYRELVILKYPGEDGQIEATTVWMGSVLGELRELALFLVKRYGWEEEQAVWFILTGAVRRPSPLRMRRTMFLWPSLRISLTMTVEPWVPAREVLRAYRDFQKQSLGRENRPLGDRGLALVRFVTVQTEDRGDRPSWRELLGRWNRTQRTEWHYSAVRLFHLSYRRAQDRLVAPRNNRR